MQRVIASLCCGNFMKVIWHHYTGINQLKRGTAACERHGPIHKAKIRLGSSLQPELFKQ